MYGIRSDISSKWWIWFMINYVYSNNIVSIMQEIGLDFKDNYTAAQFITKTESLNLNKSWKINVKLIRKDVHF